MLRMHYIRAWIDGERTKDQADPRSQTFLGQIMTYD